MVAGCKGVSSPLRMSESWQTHPHTHVTEEFGGERKSEKTITEQTNFVIFFNYINFQGRAQKNAHGKTGYRLLYGRKRVWSRFHQSRTCTELYVYNTTHSHTHSKWFPDFDFGIVCDVQHFQCVVFFSLRHHQFYHLVFAKQIQSKASNSAFAFFRARFYNKSIIIIKLTSFGVAVIWTDLIWNTAREMKKKNGFHNLRSNVWDNDTP